MAGGWVSYASCAYTWLVEILQAICLLCDRSFSCQHTITLRLRTHNRRSPPLLAHLARTPKMRTRGLALAWCSITTLSMILPRYLRAPSRRCVCARHGCLCVRVVVCTQKQGETVDNGCQMYAPEKWRPRCYIRNARGRSYSKLEVSYAEPRKVRCYRASQTWKQLSFPCRMLGSRKEVCQNTQSSE